MSSPLMRFPWPALPGTATPPVWNGSEFVVGGKAQRVVPYHDNSSAWSAELTELHEQEAGDGWHPIDVASRRLALSTLSRLKSDAIVLDVGCSSGWFLRDMKAETTLQPVGADYIAQPLNGLARRLPGVPLLQFDLRECPLPTASVDAVVALNVLEHIDDDERALGHMARILKPGGLAHIEVPSCPGCYDVYDEHLMHHRRYRMSELLAKVKRAGLRTVRTTHLGFLPFPAFWLTKRKYKKGSLSTDQIKARVAAQIRSTSHSGLLRVVLAIDEFLAARLPLPFGIRCVVVAERV